MIANPFAGQDFKIRQSQAWQTQQMPEQEHRLFAALAEMGFCSTPKPPSPRLATLAPPARAAILDLYRELGGTHPEPRLAPGAWDSCYESDLIVEYDESQHFNRYRAKTLEPAWAADLPWRHDYLGYCGEFEEDCLKSRGWGGYWSNDSTERMFGAASPSRDLTGAGSPRWKQRALYDAMRDIAAARGMVRLARLAAYDDVGGNTLGRVLSRPASMDHGALRALLEVRILSG